MIATILPNAAGFPGVNYNEKKVRHGKATLLEISGFGTLGQISIPTNKELIEYLEEYSNQNTRIQKPQFHLAISCKGKEMSARQLLDFAHSYLKEMGYGDSNQPILIYHHNDTDNNHIHIITSRVSPDGKKIDDHNERRRSQKVIDKLLGQKASLQAEKDIKIALTFNFRSETQFKAILESMNYECYEKDGEIMIKKGGMVQASIKQSELSSYINRNKSGYTEQNFYQLKCIFAKYKDLNSDINGLKSDLRKKFGIELVFFGKKDSPYGFVAVDFKNKSVIEGAKIMSIKNLIDFRSPEEHFERIDSFIDQCFQINPDITTSQLNKRLKKFNATIKKDEIIFGTRRKKLKSFIAESLNINNKVAWISSFQPKSRQEISFLGKICGLDQRTLSTIEINLNTKSSDYSKNIISDTSNISDPSDRYRYLRTEGFRIVNHNGTTFAYNPQKHCILDLDKLKIRVSNQNQLQKQQQANRTSKSNINNIVNSGSGTGDNREWEVGTKKGWDEESGKQMSY